MKIISEYEELKGKEFNSVRECAEEEAKVYLNRLKNRKEEESKRKEELLKIIAEADKAVEDAYANYDATKEKVRKILEESNEKMTKLISDSTALVKNAEKFRRDAIWQYTAQFGVYQKVHNEDGAVAECSKDVKPLNTPLRDVINAFIAN